MRVLVVGCGSIGARRARILKHLGHEVYLYDKDDQKARNLADKICAHWHPAPTAVSNDVTLICTPPGSGRLNQVHRAVVSGARGVFVEKPVALELGLLQAMADLAWRYHNVITMGACNLRFACKLQRNLDEIPRPWRSARFVMRQHSSLWSKGHQPISLILDSIHELDLAVAFQGPITKVEGFSKLNECLVKVTHEHGLVSFIEMDRILKPAERYVVITDPAGDIHREDVNTFNMYKREMEHFIECVEEGRPTCNPLDQAARTCQWALEIVQ